MNEARPKPAAPARQFQTPRELREAIRRGEFRGPTAGLCPGYVQTNVVIVPAADAQEFAEFCRQNPQPCPLMEMTAPGDPEPKRSAPGADLRTDVPRYRVFRRGAADKEEPQDIRSLWRGDFVAMLLGCSFTFEAALIAAGLPVRHIEEGRNVPMYVTNVPCAPAGKFAGPMVVSMRPYRPEQIDEAIRVTAQFPQMHGAPVHVGDPAILGIRDMGRPDFGEAVTIREGEIPAFWACGVTPQLALENARCELAITHSPGHMFVTDLKDERFRLEAGGRRLGGR
ncbi:MAG: putative hydro-lyase [Planctomycetia bacterium]|nr:putative hydro-lyase [Planctomycetia bacterium]